MKPQTESLQPHPRPRSAWIGWAAIASMLVVLVALYLVARTPDETWPWVAVLALGYLVPVSLSALYWGSKGGLVSSLLASASLIAAEIYGWQQGRPAYALAGLGRVGLLLPTAAALVGHRTSARRQRGEPGQETVLQVRELITLNEIGKTILASLDIDVRLNEIMEQVKEAFHVEAGSLLLEEGGRLVFEVSFGTLGELVKPLTLEMGQGIAGWVTMTGVSVLVADAKQDGRHFDSVDQLTGYETHSLLCVPLEGSEDRVIGALEIMNPLTWGLIQRAGPEAARAGRRIRRTGDRECAALCPDHLPCHRPLLSAQSGQDHLGFARHRRYGPDRCSRDRPADRCGRQPDPLARQPNGAGPLRRTTWFSPGHAS